MLRRASRLASPEPVSPRAKPIRSHGSADRVIEGLRELYAAPEWTLLTEVRSELGAPHDVLRVADAIAVCTTGEGPITLHGVEVKVSRADWLRELADPLKAQPIKLFCRAWYLAVPAPWKRVVLALSELPDLWGLIEVGTGAPSVIKPAFDRPEAEPPSDEFLMALFRSVQRLQVAPASGGAPMVPITRPALSRTHVGLACGHVAPRPLAKLLPRAVACWSCAGGYPTDRELVEAARADLGAVAVGRAG